MAHYFQPSGDDRLSIKGSGTSKSLSVSDVSRCVVEENGTYISVDDADVNGVNGVNGVNDGHVNDLELYVKGVIVTEDRGPPPPSKVSFCSSNSFSSGKLRT